MYSIRVKMEAGAGPYSLIHGQRARMRAAVPLWPASSPPCTGEVERAGE